MLKNFIHDKIKGIDVFIGFAVVIFLTYHPYYLHQKINFFELGLYLPGIQAILDGQMPYKDFFYLRAPLDLYFAALSMKIFGINVAVLCTYFYLGTIVTLCACVLIAKEIIPSRLLFHVLIPVLVLRTFPRVVFTYWGGMRYAWGLLAVWCVIKFIRTKKRAWILFAGLLTVVATLTSIEIGVCLVVAITVTLAWAHRRGLMVYWILFVAFLLPYNYYLAMHGAWGDYFNTQIVVATQLTHTFPQTEPVPASINEILHALFIPTDKNFRQMTPLYCYFFFIGYLIWRWRTKRLDWIDQAATVVAVYGFMVYVTGFRNLWSNVFEMSLQPQKIIMFYMLARLVSHFWNKRKTIAYVLIALIVVSSLVFSVQRMNKRFLFFRKDPLAGQETKRLNLPRLNGFVIPKEQAEDIFKVNSFVSQYVNNDEKILMYPELGAMHFIVDRPWVGRFSTPTLAWFSPIWVKEWMGALEKDLPRYAVVLKQMPDYFDFCYFLVESNRHYFKETMDFIAKRYERIDQTPNYWLLKRID